MDKLKGKIKEVAGAVIGDEDLEHEGEVQQAKAEVSDEAKRLDAEAEQKREEAELKARERELAAEQERVVKPAEPEVWPPAVAFDALEAGIKQFAGAVLRDNELVEEGRIKQAKVSAARRAVELEAEAEDREQRDEQLRQQVQQEAELR